jgi:hypothetical protein
MKGKLIRSNAVVIYMRFGIHRYVAAPIELLFGIRNFPLSENGIRICIFLWFQVLFINFHNSIPAMSSKVTKNHERNKFCLYFSWSVLTLSLNLLFLVQSSTTGLGGGGPRVWRVGGGGEGGRGVFQTPEPK